MHYMNNKCSGGGFRVQGSWVQETVRANVGSKSSVVSGMSRGFLRGFRVTKTAMQLTASLRTPQLEA